MNDDQELFIRECAAHARALPVSQAIVYLRGLLLMCPNVKEADALRGVFNSLVNSDRQLQLIHMGQLELDFTIEKGRDGDGHRKKKGGK